MSCMGALRRNQASNPTWFSLIGDDVSSLSGLQLIRLALYLAHIHTITLSAAVIWVINHGRPSRRDGKHPHAS